MLCSLNSCDMIWIYISPKADVRIHNCFYLPENAADFDFSEYDYVVDAVDTVTAKIELIMRAKEAGTPVISSMGAEVQEITPGYEGFAPGVSGQVEARCK